MGDPCRPAAIEAVRLIGADRPKPVKLLDACLARIAEREPDVGRQNAI
jgi:hypothetical protein